MVMKNLLITDKETIRKALGKTSLDVLKDVNIIKVWLKTQKHLPEFPSADMIEFFLTNCKYSIEKTKQNLDMYYTIRTLMPDIYHGLNPCKPSEIDVVHRTGMACFLPKLTPDLYRVLMFKLHDIDSDQTDMNKFCAHTVNNLYEVRIHEDLAMGDVVILDYKSVKISVMAKITPITMKNLSQIFQKVHSNRLKGIHLLNTPGYLNVFNNLFKSFLPKKLQERMFIHPNLEDLYKYVPRENLPQEYGGEEIPLAELQDLWEKHLVKFEKRFLQLDNMKVNEDLRPQKLENDEILGYHGNFKNIAVD